MPDPRQWGIQLDAAVCENCDWSYLLPPNSPPQRCPHCFKAQLTAVNNAFDQLAYIHPPELVIAPKVDDNQIAVEIETFAKGIPFRARDLTAENLSQRLRRSYIPLWLVDGTVQATWQAEVGFDYKVVSHRERYSQNDNRWNTQEVKENRIRWEPRVGRLRRSYHNQYAPALEDEVEMQQRLGQYDLKTAEPYQPQLMAQTFIRLPNRPPEDAWPEAQPSFLKSGIVECQKAAEADHIRDYHWTAEFHKLNWTQLLRPAYSTYYLDDDGQPHTVLLNGQSGYISGSRRSSMKRARRWTLITLAIALVIFLIGVAAALAGYFLEPALLTVGALALLISLGLTFLALIPLFIAWNFNRREQKK